MIGKMVNVVVDRPLGSRHPKHEDIVYPVNYGYIPGIMAPDGEEQDAYILGVDQPVEAFAGKVIAIIHRFDDVEEKWVVAPGNATFSQKEIMSQVAFQEQYFCTELRTVSLIRATPEDLEQMQTMQKAAFLPLLEKYQDHDTNPYNEAPERILWKIQQPGSYYYLIKAVEGIVGAIHIWDTGNGARKRISPLYILPAYQGRGYAQSAMGEAERIHGEHHWELDTILQEAGNCYLYEKMGYHRTDYLEAINEKMTLVGYEKD
jgi:inorganic pyrophosphatase